MKLPRGAHLVPRGALGQSTQSISAGRVLQKVWFEMHAPPYKPMRYGMGCWCHSTAIPSGRSSRTTVGVCRQSCRRGPWEQSFRRAWSQTTGLPANPYVWASSNGNIPPPLPRRSRGPAGSVGSGSAGQGTVSSSTLSCSSVSALLASCHRNGCRLSCHQKKVCALRGEGVARQPFLH